MDLSQIPELSGLPLDKLPKVDWGYIGKASFWLNTTNLLNFYIYLAVAFLPTTFVWTFFAIQQDEKRLSGAFKQCFTIVALIIPGILVGFHIVVKIYQSITRALSG